MFQDTETLDRLYIEWSQFTRARNAREIVLVKALEHARKNLEIAVRVNGGDPADHVTIKEIDAALALARGG